MNNLNIIELLNIMNDEVLEIKLKMYLITSE